MKKLAVVSVAVVAVALVLSTARAAEKVGLITGGEKRNCQTVGRFAQVIARQLPWLTEHGHPTWKARPAAAAGSANPVSEAINRALGN